MSLRIGSGSGLRIGSGLGLGFKLGLDLGLRSGLTYFSGRLALSALLRPKADSVCLMSAKGYNNNWNEICAMVSSCIL